MTPLSSCESEYFAATNAAMTLMYLKDLVEDITGVEVKTAIPIYCDNSAACQLAEDTTSGKRVKHALRKMTYLRELQEDGKLSLKFISGDVNAADIFTKCLPGARFTELRQMLLDEGTTVKATALQVRGTSETTLAARPRGVLILFSGPYDRDDGLGPMLTRLGYNTTLVDNDADNGGIAEHDLLDDKFYFNLLKAATCGEFGAVVAAPPCSTFSVARYFSADDEDVSGPLPVRTRLHPLGIPNQPPSREREARAANEIVKRTCNILYEARQSGAEFLLENPADHGDPDDPYTYLHKEHAPIWVLPDILKLREIVGAELITLPMCELGHHSQKMTTLMVTPKLAKQLSTLGQLRCTHKRHRPVAGMMRQGKWISARTAAYPTMFNQILTFAIANALTDQADGDGNTFVLTAEEEPDDVNPDVAARKAVRMPTMLEGNEISKHVIEIANILTNGMNRRWPKN